MTTLAFPKGRAPERHPRYLAALRRLPCLICAARPTEAAHIRLRTGPADADGMQTGAGGAEKPDDRHAVPLCAHHHRTGPQAEHVIGTRAFWQLHDIDPHKAADALWTAFNGPDPDDTMAWVLLSHQMFGSFFVKEKAG